MSQEYFIQKIRFESGDGGWSDWEYRVNPNPTERINSLLRETKSHKTLEDLARQMEKFPEIATAELHIGYLGRVRAPYVSLCNRALTQYGRISDEELGILALLIQRQVALAKL